MLWGTGGLSFVVEVWTNVYSLAPSGPQPIDRVFYFEFILKRVELARNIEFNLKNIPIAPSRVREIT